MRARSSSLNVRAAGQLEVVVEAVLDRRADGELGAREQVEHRLGQHVRRRVAQHRGGPSSVSPVTIATVAPSVERPAEVALARRRPSPPTAALARPRPIDAASSPPVAPVGYSRSEPSGSVIVMFGHGHRVEVTECGVHLLAQRLTVGRDSAAATPYSAAPIRPVRRDADEEPPWPAPPPNSRCPPPPTRCGRSCATSTGSSSWMPGIEKSVADGDDRVLSMMGMTIRERPREDWTTGGWSRVPRTPTGRRRAGAQSPARPTGVARCSRRRRLAGALGKIAEQLAATSMRRALSAAGIYQPRGRSGSCPSPGRGTSSSRSPCTRPCRRS